MEEAVGDIMYLLMHVCSSVLMDAHDLIVIQAYRPQRPSYKLLIAMSYFCLPVHSHVHNPTLHHWTWSILVFFVVAMFSLAVCDTVLVVLISSATSER